MGGKMNRIPIDTAGSYKKISFNKDAIPEKNF